MTANLTFLGGVGTVTGSKYLLAADGHTWLIDCGLFQGFKQLRLRNWASFPVAPGTIDAVLLTHAHLDHSGYLPRLVAQGFKGRIHSTLATSDLCGILLPDSAYLQERDAEFANRHQFSKHNPALPLYTQEQAEKALKHFAPIAFNEPLDLAGGVQARFHYAGHILGAAIISLNFGERKIVFSGDLGRTNDPMMFDPEQITETDYLVVESTYGNRKHDTRDAEDALADAVTRTARRGGTLLIPSFAVGRAQRLLYHLYRLKEAKRIPDLPIFLDSPMAVDASDIFCAHPKDHKLSAEETRRAFAVARYVHTAEESKRLDANTVPKVIISASGMATGGRVLHHLKNYVSDPRNTILFVGFQAGGTRGAAMVAGAQSIKMHGEYIPVRAEVEDLHMLSAHADADEILGWLSGFRKPPAMTFVTHGEPEASDALRHRISEELGWPCMVPEQGQEAKLA
jgi:metallo-beta-lactamase family protein